MGGQFGVKEAGDFVKLGAGMVKAYNGAMADGRFGLEDLAQLIPVGILVQPAVEGAGIAMQELGELDGEDKVMLHQLVEAEMGESVPEKVAEDILLIGVHVAGALSTLKAAREAAEPAPAPAE